MKKIMFVPGVGFNCFFVYGFLFFGCCKSGFFESSCCLQSFEEEYDCNVEYYTYDTNETMYNQFTLQPEGTYDLICASEYMLQRTWRFSRQTYQSRIHGLQLYHFNLSLLCFVSPIWHYNFNII